jgi:hypothetical protein
VTATFNTAPTTFDFTLSATPASLTVTAGGTATVTLKATLTSGAGQTVNLSASGCLIGPSGGATAAVLCSLTAPFNGCPILGAACSFNPSSVTPTSGGASSTLTIIPQGSIPAGTYPITITATSGSLQRQATVQLTVPAAGSGTGFRLQVFPLPNKTHTGASINSVFDHSMTTTYCADDRVVAYTGEEGQKTFGSDRIGNVTGCGDLFGLKNAAGTSFSLKGQYTGGGSPQFLYYDGHPGYDYRTVDQCPGGTVTTDCPTGIRGQLRVRAAVAGTVKNLNTTFGRIEIDHGNGYETWYMHLSRFDVIVGQSVSAGQFIGLAGDIGVAGSPHLHFEVRKSGVAVDPYGWEGSGADPYTKAQNLPLW